MATFRDLLNTLKTLSQKQLDQEVMIIPTGYCSAAEVEIDGFSPFKGEVTLGISKGDIIYEEGVDSPMCGGGISGTTDVEEWDTPASELAKDLSEGEELYSQDSVVLGPGLPYIRIANKD
ncbi:MAG: hypothetical protein MJZ16_14540 [Bacteroidales bacterium]|nr:hypothetical protein [Bacteroidales bacterium]